MRIAVTYDNGNIFQHFGHTESFKVYEVEEDRSSLPGQFRHMTRSKNEKKARWRKMGRHCRDNFVLRQES